MRWAAATWPGLEEKSTSHPCAKNKGALEKSPILPSTANYCASFGRVYLSLA